MYATTMAKVAKTTNYMSYPPTFQHVEYIINKSAKVFNRLQFSVKQKVEYIDVEI